MALTYGFYNSNNGDRKYSATDFSRLFEGVFTDGIFREVGNAFNVSANGTDMTVSIGTGRAWFKNTWTDNDSVIDISIDQSELSLNRIDVIVLIINKTNRVNSMECVRGTPASQPEVPIVISSGDVYRYPLAYVRVNAQVTKIIGSNIINMIGTEVCPYLRTIVDNDAVPVARKINDKTLDSDVFLSASDVGAIPTTRKVNDKTLSADISLNATDVGAVPLSRKVNDKTLNADISLNAIDVGAATANHDHGDISYIGVMNSTMVAATNQDCIVITDASANNQLKRGVPIGSNTSTFLRNDGAWTSPEIKVKDYTVNGGSTVSVDLTSSHAYVTRVSNASTTYTITITAIPAGSMRLLTIAGDSTLSGGTINKPSGKTYVGSPLSMPSASDGGITFMIFCSSDGASVTVSKLR